MEKNTEYHAVISMIQRRIAESRSREEASNANEQHELTRQLLGEQEYGIRRGLLLLWEDINAAVEDSE